MDKNTQPRRHIDTLTVVYGHAFVVQPTETIPLGERPRSERDEPSPWLYYPAGRGE